MKNWVKTTIIKTAKTMAQTALGLLTASTLITEVDWLTVLSAVALSGMVCILMNVGNIELKSEEE